MATMNPFDLLGDDDAEDPSQLIAAQQLKVVEAKKPSVKPTTKPAPAQAKMPSKPLPPSQAVREARSEPARGGRGSRGGYGPGRGGGAYRDSAPRDSAFGSVDLSTGQGNSNVENNGNRTFERRGGYGGPRGGRRGGFSNGEPREGDFDRPRRTYDRRSGTGRGNEMKRERSGRGNWGTRTDGDEVAKVVEEVAIEGEKPLIVKKTSGEEDAKVDADKEAPKNKAEVKEPEDKEMTLEEYEKLLEEKRKALMALKTEERKVDPDEFASMQPLANKKAGDDVFIKLGSDKDKKKEQAEKEERAKKSMSINAFLKPTDGEKSYNRGRGRGRGGPREASYYNGNNTRATQAPAIEDPSQFPSLGGK